MGHTAGTQNIFRPHKSLIGHKSVSDENLCMHMKLMHTYHDLLIPRNSPIDWYIHTPFIYPHMSQAWMIESGRALKKES